MKAAYCSQAGGPEVLTYGDVADPVIGDGDVLALVGGGVGYRIGRMEVGLGVRHGLAGHTAGLVASSDVMASF